MLLAALYRSLHLKVGKLDSVMDGIRWGHDLLRTSYPFFLRCLCCGCGVT